MATTTDPERVASGRPRRKWSADPVQLLAAGLLWVGLVVFSYPNASAWVAQYNQSRIVRDYTEAIDRVKPSKLEQLAAARAYNEELSSGAVYQAGSNIAEGSGELADGVTPYYQQLNPGFGGPMARLKIPRIDLDLPVYHGTSEETLLRGLGHLQGTSLPVGGVGTRSVITGHRGLASAAMFTELDKVGMGDTFTVEVLGEVLTYRVVETKVVAPDETQALLPDPHRDLLTLVTCTPLSINTHRILLTGERVTPTPQVSLDAAGADPTIPHFPWWAVTLAGGIALVGVDAWRSGYPRRAPRHRL